MFQNVFGLKSLNMFLSILSSSYVLAMFFINVALLQFALQSLQSLKILKIPCFHKYIKTYKFLYNTPVPLI